MSEDARAESVERIAQLEQLRAAIYDAFTTQPPSRAGIPHSIAVDLAAGDAARAVLAIVEDHAKAERRAEQDRVAIDAQAGYTSVQQNADEGWSRINALQPLREAIESKFTEGSHAVLLAVRDSQWVKDIRKAERKAGAVDALREVETWAKRNPGLRMWQLLELVAGHIDRLEAS